MFFRKRKFDYVEKKEEILLTMVQDVGLALSPEEKKELEDSGFIDTGKYNGHGQPLLKNVNTGQVLPFCRAYCNVDLTCNLNTEDINKNPYGNMV